MRNLIASDGNRVWNVKLGKLILADYPCLKLVCWNRPDDGTVTRAEALALYERNWRHIKDVQMDEKEQQLFDDLIKNEGRGAFPF